MNRDLRLIDANAPVRREHTCDICGRRAPWGDGWQWYGSYLDYEDSWGDRGIVVVCSPECLAELESVGATWFLNQKRRENGMLPVPKRYR